jgi:hypothetical protein
MQAFDYAQGTKKTWLPTYIGMTWGLKAITLRSVTRFDLWLRTITLHF